MFEGHRKNDKKSWKLPSGKDFRVIGKIIDNNNYLVLEVSDWVPVSADVLKKPVKVKKGISTARPFVCGNWDSRHIQGTISQYDCSA